jgi:ATP-binding cassette subfamily C (CFTR/MRP) protein 2
MLSANRCVAASRVLHRTMLSAVLRAPLAFFDTTPTGRILNRFSRDIDTTDGIIPELLESWMISAFGVLAVVAVLCYATPIFLAVAAPLAVIYYFAQVALL